MKRQTSKLSIQLLLNKHCKYRYLLNIRHGTLHSTVHVGLKNVAFTKERNCDNRQQDIGR